MRGQPPARPHEPIAASASVGRASVLLIQVASFSEKGFRLGAKMFCCRKGAAQPPSEPGELRVLGTAVEQIDLVISN
jgi:hypothetical protein